MLLQSNWLDPCTLLLSWLKLPSSVRSRLGEELAGFVLEGRHGIVERILELSLLCLALPLFQILRSNAFEKLLLSVFFFFLWNLLAVEIRAFKRINLRFLGLFCRLVERVVQHNPIELPLLVVPGIIVVTLVLVVVVKQSQIDVFFVVTVLLKAVALKSHFFLLFNSCCLHNF